ncbi:MAG: thiamine pyrophosphate-binding protein [Xanthobacteraceae bacterium]
MAKTARADKTKEKAENVRVRVASALFADKDLPVGLGNKRLGWGSDVIAEMLRQLDVRYISLVPGSSFRGLHDSLVNYLGNEKPKMLLCLHEEHAVAIAQGYSKVTDRPMAVALHSGVGLMHATMAIYNAWCARRPVVILGATGPGDADLRRPWIDWIHTSKDQGAIIRNYIKWDDEPRSAAAAIESMLRAWQIASTPPYGPTYVCLDVAMQEAAVPDDLAFPDVQRFQPGLPPAPAAEAVEEAAKLLVAAKKPVILMGRVSRSEDDWQARIKLAESIGAAVLTDVKAYAAFPSEHPLHVVEPRFRPSPAVADLMKEADVILSLDWIDLQGQLQLALGKKTPAKAKIINCSLDRYIHNGWSMDYQGLPPADVPILSTPDALSRPLTAAINRLRGSSKPVKAKFPPRAAPELPKPRTGVMGLRDLALVVRDFIKERGDVTLATLALGYPSETLIIDHPLDFLAFDSGGGVGSGPGNAVGTALALKDSGRLVMSVMGDGNFLMGVTAFWTAAHMEIPLLVVIANNRGYFNDIAHQERVAVERERPVENKAIGQEIKGPDVDLAGMARNQGVAAEGPVETAAELAAALARAEKVVRAGRPYVIDARIDPGYADEARRGHTGGRSAH